MKLLIDIPQEAYKLLQTDGVDWLGAEHILNAVANGIPLPKGHGELKDATAMISKLCTNEASELFGSVTCAEFMDFINDADTIIEANKESEVRNEV